MKPHAWPLQPQAYIFLCIVAFLALQVIAHFSRKRQYRRAWANFAEAYEGNEYRESVPWITRAIAIHPEICILYFYRGIVLAQTQSWERALADFSHYIQMLPHNSRGYVYRGAIYATLGIFELARVDFEQAQRCNPNNAMACIAHAWLLATCPLSHLRDGEKGMVYARQACELTSWKWANALGTLAATLAECGDFAGAIRWANKALEAQEPYSARCREEAQRMLDAFSNNKPFRDDRWWAQPTTPAFLVTSIKEGLQ